MLSIDTLNSFDIIIPIFHSTFIFIVGGLEGEEMNYSPEIKHMPFIQTLALL